MSSVASRTTPRVSVIVPVYNREALVAICLESILAQTYPHLEVIVVDDGSTDGTPGVLRKYANRIRIIRQDNAGPYVARNRALAVARGEFIAFVDSDDSIHPEKIARQVQHLDEHADVILVYTHVAYRDLAGALHTPGRSARPSLRGDLSREIVRSFRCNIPWATAMIRAEAIRKVGPFDTTHRVAMDREMGIRLAQVGRFDVIEAPLYELTLHQTHVSQDICKREKAAFYMLAKALRMEPYCRDRALKRHATGVMRRELARLCYMHGASRKARAHLAAALAADPSLYFRPQVFFLGLKVLLGREAVQRIGRALGVRSHPKWARHPQEAAGSQEEQAARDPKVAQELRYAVITPARDEESHLEGLIASMTRQARLPVRWVVVDDGSGDRTAEMVARHLDEVPFLRLVRRPPGGARALGGRVVEAFCDGLRQIDLESVDFVVKLDADLIFEPDYFAELLARFGDDPRLGIAGGACHMERGGQVMLEKTPPDHVRGATKVYRRETFQAIGGLRPTLGWDTIDEIRAQMMGWRTKTFPHLAVIQRRQTGSVGGILRGRFRQGLTAWLLGYHPLFLALRAARVAVQEPPLLMGGIALKLGFLRAAVRGGERAATRGEIAFLRARQLRRMNPFRR